MKEMISRQKETSPNRKVKHMECMDTSEGTKEKQYLSHDLCGHTCNEIPMLREHAITCTPT